MDRVPRESEIVNAPLKLGRSRPAEREPQSKLGWTDAALVGMTFIWGSNFIVVKTALREFSPFTFVSLRFLAAGLVLFVIVRWRHSGFSIPRRAWGRVALVGVLGTTIYQPLFISGLALGKASTTSLILSTTPAFIMVLNRLLGRERFTARGWIGVLLSFGGVGLIVQAGGDAFDPASLRGDLLLFAATLCWSLYSVISVPLLKRYSSLAVTALSTVFGAVPLFLLGLPAILSQDWSSVSPGSWSGLGYSAIFAIVVAYVIWNLGVQRIGGARTAIYNNLTPLIATVAAAVFLNEALTPLKLIGALVIFGGLYLARTASIIVEPEA